jgi:hypothetical protein
MQERLLQLHPVADIAHEPMHGHHIVRNSQPHLQPTNNTFEVHACDSLPSQYG